MSEMLRIDSLSFSYKKKVKREVKETKIFDNLSFSIEEGSFVGLIGSSGAGKSTLLSLITGILYPDNGRIILNNEDITDLTIQSRDISYIFQKPVLYPHLTVYQNIRMGLYSYKVSEEEKDIAVKKMLKTIGLTSKLNFKPRHLSDGEQELVALAKALIREPKILLLDEPFASLDEENKKKSLEMLRTLRKEHNTTVLMSSNRFKEVSNGDKIILIDDGKIIFDGEPIEMIRSENLSIKSFVE